MDGLKLQTSLGVSLPVCVQSVPGMGARSSVQDGGVQNQYDYGSSGTGKADQVLWKPQELNPSGTATIDLAAGADVNPLGEVANFNRAKLFYLLCSDVDNGGTATAPDGVTVAVNAALAAALGFAAAFTKTLLPTEYMVVEYAPGRALATGSMLVTNLSAATKARLLVVFAGFKP